MIQKQFLAFEEGKSIAMFEDPLKPLLESAGHIYETVNPPLNFQIHYLVSQAE